MKFLLVTPYYYPSTSYGGPIYSVKELAENLAKKGFDVTVLTSNINRDFEVYKNKKTVKKLNKVKIIYFRLDYFNFFKTNIFGYFYSSELYKFLKDNINKYDIVHSQINFNYFSYISLKLAQKNNIINFFSQRGTYSVERLKSKSFKKRLYLFFFEKKLLKNCTKLIALNELEKKYYNNLGFYKKIIKIPNGINRIKHKSDRNISKFVKKDKINIIFLARISRLKGIDLLLKTIDDYQNKLKYFHFHIAGYDEEGYFKSINKELLKKNNVTYYGHLNSNQKYSLIKKMDALILPSFGEGLSISILEALYFKKIILTSYLIKFSNEKFEINFNLNNKSIFNGLKKFEKLKFSNQFKIETNNANKYVLENYSWKNIIEKYLKLSRNALIEKNYD
jgi:glycosyltransferase involved in cell wall biosynthesis